MKLMWKLKNNISYYIYHCYEEIETLKFKIKNNIQLGHVNVCSTVTYYAT